MNRVPMIAFFAILATAAQVFGQVVDDVSWVSNNVMQKECDDCGKCDDCCAGSYGGGFFASAEMLFFKYMKADGVRAGNFSNNPSFGDDSVTFDYSATPRLTFGYAGAGGLGIRARYWEFDQRGDARFPPTGAAMGVDTWLLDVEVFERVQMNDCWDVEISGGLRYNEFEEVLTDPIPLGNRLNAFDGWGGVLGLEARRSLRLGSMFVRARGAILQDGDKVVRNFGAAAPATGATQDALLTDVTHSALELAIGYEVARETRFGLAFMRLGYEWQEWDNYSTHYTLVTTSPTNPGASYSGPADIGFSGFTLGFGIER